MVNILDLSSGDWAREMEGNPEWEIGCAEENPYIRQSAGCPGVAVRQLEFIAVTMPSDLLGCDLDKFLTRMQAPEIE